MVIVLIAARYKKILDWMQKACVEDIQSMDIIKQDGAKIYLYVDTSLTLSQTINKFHKVIYQACQGVYIYQLYGIYNGKIDFHDYLPAESKDKMSYYHTHKKDITEKEVQDYIQQHS